MLTDIHKTKRLGSALTFHILFSKGEDEFLNRIVTRYETCVCHVTPELKQQSMGFRHKNVVSTKSHVHCVLGQTEHFACSVSSQG